MNFTIILGIAGCGVLLNRAILIYLRKKYTQQLIKAIQSRNETEYQRLVFSKSARILMEPNVVNLARASLYSRRKEDQACRKMLESIRRQELSLSQQAFYYTLYLNLVLKENHESEYLKLQNELLSIYKKTGNPALKSAYQTSELMRKLNFRFDPSVIDDLKRALPQVEEKERRMLLLLLSQAYHENHQEKMAEIYRHKAEEELLKMKEVRMANPLFDE